MNLLFIIFNLVVTAAIYGAFPFVFSLVRESSIKRKSFKWMCIGYVVLISFIFAIYDTISGYKISFGPALLWGIVFYNVGLKNLMKRGILDEEVKQK